MQLKIKSLTGATHDISVPEFGTVSDVKTAVKAVLGIPPEVQRLIFIGRELADDTKPLTEYKVVDGSVLHLVIRADAQQVAAAPRRNSQYADLEGQGQVMPQMVNSGQNPVAMGFLSERVYNAFRLARVISILAIIDIIQVVLFGFISPLWLIFLPLCIGGYWAAKTLRHWLIIPYIVFQLFTIGLQIFIFKLLGAVSIFGILSILIDGIVIFLCVRFLFLVMKLDQAEKDQVVAMRNPDHSRGYYAYW